MALKQEARQPNSVLAAEINRRKEPLEAYPLDSMAMVGSVVKQGRQYALLRVDNLLYQVKVGDYLGQLIDLEPCKPGSLTLCLGLVGEFARGRVGDGDGVVTRIKEAIGPGLGGVLDHRAELQRRAVDAHEPDFRLAVLVGPENDRHTASMSLRAGARTTWSDCASRISLSVSGITSQNVRVKSKGVCAIEQKFEYVRDDDASSSGTIVKLICLG